MTFYEFLEKKGIGYPTTLLSPDHLKEWLKEKGMDVPALMKEFQESEIPESNLKVLKDPNLFNNINLELDKKICGEYNPRKVIIICAYGGRLVANSQIASFNLLLNDETGVGKDYVGRNSLEHMLPQDIYVHKTRISPTVFTYWHNSKFEPTWTWDGKVFYAEDISESVLNSDVFKVMCSSGSSATVVIKQQAIDIQIKGKPVIITTTASSVPSPELIRRFAILNLDSSIMQTTAIMKKQSKLYAKGKKPDYNPIFAESISYLQRVTVVIPFAELIDAHFPKQTPIMRTHYPRFLDFICASAALHQCQRQRDEDGFVLAEKEDYEIAKECIIILCSNKFMIPLTINQKKILEVFESERLLKGSLVQLHPKMNFLSLKGLQTNLELLCQYGLLSEETTKDSMNRDITVYCLGRGINVNEKIKLPNFEELCRKNTESTITTTTTTPTTSTTSQDFKRDIVDIRDIVVRNEVHLGSSTSLLKDKTQDIQDIKVILQEFYNFFAEGLSAPCHDCNERAFYLCKKTAKHFCFKCAQERYKDSLNFNGVQTEFVEVKST